MKQLGNLAIICAKRTDTVFTMRNGQVNVMVRDSSGAWKETLSAAWDDDKEIEGICRELNFGDYSGGSGE